MCTFSIILQGNICSITANILLGFKNANSQLVKTFSKVQNLKKKIIRISYNLPHLNGYFPSSEWGAVIHIISSGNGRKVPYHWRASNGIGLPERLKNTEIYSHVIAFKNTLKNAFGNYTRAIRWIDYPHRSP